jgi:hypothetical protein
MKRLMPIVILLASTICLSGCTAWSIKPQTSELTVISFCKDVDVNDVHFDGKTLRVGSVSSRTSGWTESIAAVAIAIFAFP